MAEVDVAISCYGYGSVLSVAVGGVGDQLGDR